MESKRRSSRYTVMLTIGRSTISITGRLCKWLMLGMLVAHQRGKHEAHNHQNEYTDTLKYHIRLYSIVYDVVVFTVFVVVLLLWHQGNLKHEQEIHRIVANAIPQRPDDEPDNKPPTQADFKKQEKEIDDEWWVAYELANTRQPINEFIRFNENRGRTAQDVISGLQPAT